MARETGLEPATSGVTGRRSNQLSYSPAGPHVTGVTGRPEWVRDTGRVGPSQARSGRFFRDAENPGASVKSAAA